MLVASGIVVKVPWNQPAFMKLIEFPIWAALFGLTLNGILSLTGYRQAVKPFIRTELALKVGLVLLGASANVALILSVGSRGVVQAVVMICSVFLFTWYVSGRLKLPDTLRAVMACAVSICGVSAAIAAAAAVQAKKQEVTYITTLVVLVALPLMVFMPWAAKTFGLAPAWAGAWIGGNIDTTAAVVGAGTILGDTALKTATIVKMSQNALMGVVAFLLAAWFAARSKKDEKVSAAVIWHRFPKFVLGFALLSVLATVGAFSKTHLAVIKNMQNWAFALAFVFMGMDISLRELRQVGIRPIVAFLLATCFNTLLALLVSGLLFA